MRPVKPEPGIGDAQELPQQQLKAAAAATEVSDRQRPMAGGEGGAELEMQLEGGNAEAQALGLLGLERERAMREELLQAKVQIAELRADIRIKEAELKAEVASVESKLQSKDAALQLKVDGGRAPLTWLVNAHRWAASTISRRRSTPRRAKAWRG